jgi:hypothetical protein
VEPDTSRSRRTRDPKAWTSEVRGRRLRRHFKHQHNFQSSKVLFPDEWSESPGRVLDYLSELVWDPVGLSEMLFRIFIIIVVIVTIVVAQISSGD